MYHFPHLFARAQAPNRLTTGSSPRMSEIGPSILTIVADNGEKIDELIFAPLSATA
jgi:hypothetical protein